MILWCGLHCMQYLCVNGTVDENCDPHCLYNIIEDPSEHNELSKKEPEILEKMLK